VQNNGLSEFAAFMSDFWKFIKDFWIPEDTDEYFEKAVRASDEIYFRHGKDKLMAELMVTFLKNREKMLHEQTDAQAAGKTGGNRSEVPVGA